MMIMTILPKQIPCQCKLSWRINPILILILKSPTETRSNEFSHLETRNKRVTCELSSILKSLLEPTLPHVSCATYSAPLTHFPLSVLEPQAWRKQSLLPASCGKTPIKRTSKLKVFCHFLSLSVSQLVVHLNNNAPFCLSMSRKHPAEGRSGGLHVFVIPVSSDYCWQQTPKRVWQNTEANTVQWYK